MTTKQRKTRKKKMIENKKKYRNANFGKVKEDVITEKYVDTNIQTSVKIS